MVNSINSRVNGSKLWLSVNIIRERGNKLGHIEDRTRIEVIEQKSEEL